MSGCVDLHRGAEHGVVADGDGCWIQYHAVEVEVHVASKNDVRSVITIEGRLNPDSITSSSEQLANDASAQLAFFIMRVVKRLAQLPCATPFGNELRIHCVIHLTGEHLLFLD